MTQGFDPHHPPAQALIDSCVHCGFCLATCPSYRVIGKEMDSPRGRIYLMDAINKGQADLNETTSQHFDSCLGCLACVTACPSGVEYDRLIAATRPQVERNQPRSPEEKLLRSLIFGLFPYPQLLKLLLYPLALYQKSGVQTLVRKTGLLNKIAPSLGAMESILPSVNLKELGQNYPVTIPAQGPTKYRVGMILGCVQRLFFDRVNAATINVLTANGCEVIIPPDQGCCSALPAHQGQTQQAQALAHQMIAAFAGLELDAIIINAAGCGHTLKEYDHILEGDPAAIAFSAKVKDVNEFLASIDFVPELHPISDGPITVVYQDACHLLHGQKISLQPRQLLKSIPHLELKEPVDAALCCGSAGVYNILQPEVAEALGEQKVTNLLHTQAQLIVSSNPGCTLQMQKHLQLQQNPTPIFHPMELLDRSIRGVKL